MKTYRQALRIAVVTFLFMALIIVGVRFKTRQERFQARQAYTIEKALDAMADL